MANFTYSKQYQNPQILPGPKEFSLSRKYDYQILPHFYRRLSPKAVRGLVYATIAGVGKFPQLENRALQWEILVLANLIPTVWGLPAETRFIEGHKIIHTVGFCLACHRKLNFPHGDTTPLKSICIECHDEEVLPVDELPFWSSLPDWPGKYQFECVQYLIDYRSK